jgi:DnaJ-class molecular chaperone
MLKVISNSVTIWFFTPWQNNDNDEECGISGLLEIKLAYRQMVRRYHPDVCPPTEREECTRRFLQVQEAYDTLSDPHLRADYDLWLQNPLNTRSIGAGLRAGNRRRTGVRPDPNSTQWKDHWESQLTGLHNRSAKRESWASRMRRKRDEVGDVNND